MRSAVRRALLCAGFAAGLAVLLALCSLVAVPKSNTRKAGIFFPATAGIEGEQDQTIDALFLGDSECYFAISPLLLWQERGYATYVCGTPNQKMYETMEWLEKACRRQSPKLVLLEVDALYNPMEYSECLTLPLVRVFPVLKYHNRWKSLKWADFTKRPAYGHRVRDKDFIYNGSIVSAEDDVDYMKDDGQEERISPLSRLYFDRIAAFCRERDIRLMLISTPSRVMWDARRHNGVADLSQKYGLEYVDMNQRLDEIGIDWSSDTLDQGHHMIASGAMKVSSYVARLLDETGLLSDHRGEMGYKRWNRALKQARKRGQQLVYYEGAGAS